ncbi:vacuolar sorting protein 28, putative [Babesia bigemina]|uniref:Vacuolar sorting protein 28, putative n=1 Tax=Babesia bigemina TaxID=5866 RepID=A0A061D9U1_BABBI|nr:vacuolar sorting protein 28, putative [Babesia bigemina]CDR94505.1 vacuolar sorting protein 28, putative [Babesia bigemina]|eukprot:XP_012766691.1 vacuolar sorting protein 28, putative [Babesia bigemina]
MASTIDVDHAANIYSLLQALEHLEQAFVSGDASNEDYTQECTELLSLCHILEEATPNVFAEFAAKHNLNCPLALNRLKKGSPGICSTSKPKAQARSEVGRYFITLTHVSLQTYIIFELSEHFITLLDALKLGSTHVEELFPILHELITCLDYVPTLDDKSSNSVNVVPHLDKLRVWCSRLENMPAHHALDANEIRQLTMEAEAAYSALKAFLRMKTEG